MNTEPMPGRSTWLAEDDLAVQIWIGEGNPNEHDLPHGQALGNAEPSILPRPDRFPLPPEKEASPDCLLGRLHTIHDLLVERKKFSDAVASRAVEVVLKEGSKALESGKAARMTGNERAGWLWRVAVNAARRAAATEPTFVAMKFEPEDRHSESRDDRRKALLEALCKEINKLPFEQKQAVELHGLQGLSFRKAARLIGVCPGTVAYRYNAGLTRLRELSAVIQVGLGTMSLNARAS
jgi:hypothetical protein